MSSLQQAVWHERQETESVRQKQVLLGGMLFIGTAEHDSGHFEPVGRGPENRVSLVARQSYSNGIRHGHDCQTASSGSSANLGDLSGPSSRGSSARSSVRSQELLQRGTPSGLYCPRKHTCKDFEQYGGAECSEDVLSKVPRAVLTRSHRSSVLPSLPTRQGSGIPARPQRQAPKGIDGAQGENSKWQRT